MFGLYRSPPVFASGQSYRCELHLCFFPVFALLILPFTLMQSSCPESYKVRPKKPGPCLLYKHCWELVHYFPVFSQWRLTEEICLWSQDWGWRNFFRFVFIYRTVAIAMVTKEIILNLMLWNDYLLCSWILWARNSIRHTGVSYYYSIVWSLTWKTQARD